MLTNPDHNVRSDAARNLTQGVQLFDTAIVKDIVNRLYQCFEYIDPYVKRTQPEIFAQHLDNIVKNLPSQLADIFCEESMKQIHKLFERPPENQFMKWKYINEAIFCLNSLIEHRKSEITSSVASMKSIETYYVPKILSFIALLNFNTDSSQIIRRSFEFLKKSAAIVKSETLSTILK
jgi:hypothetical protein